MRKLVLLVGLILFTLIACKPKQHSESIYGDNNSIWAESIYLRGYHPTTHEILTVKRIKQFTLKFKRHKIKYAYLFAGPYQDDGHLPDYAFSKTAISSVKLLQRFNPDLIILPWVGGVQNNTVYLNDSTWVNNALEDAKRLIKTLEVPGIHVDFEYILEGDKFLDQSIKPERPGELESYGENVNKFHKQLRKNLPDSFISSVVVSTSPGTKPWKRKTSKRELAELILYVDQLSFLYYDTMINDQITFDNNCFSVISDIKELSQKKDIEYLIAIGTFVNTGELHKYRNLVIESIPNSLNTIKKNIKKVSRSEKIIDGIAVFCDWQTDEDEWILFDKHWGMNENLLK